MDGTFAKYIVVKGDVQMKMPDHFTDEEAATLGVSVSTVVCDRLLDPVFAFLLFFFFSPLFPVYFRAKSADTPLRSLSQGQGLYQSLKLPLPNESAKEPFPVLIYGGSTATGVYAIQFAKISGLKVLTTASPHNFDFLKSLGADAVFDYSSPTVADDIRNYTNGALTVAYGCHGSNGSSALCARCLSDAEGGRIHAVLPAKDEEIKAINPKVETSFTAAYSIVGEGYNAWRRTVAPALEDFEYARTFLGIAEELIAQGKIKSIRIAKNRGGEGLQGVLTGLNELKDGKVSGEKLVYTI